LFVTKKSQEFDMSGHGFHVHGPHDHELEHAQQGSHGGAGHGDHGGMINQIALFTAIIATVGALFGYMGGATQANAGLFKNNAAIKKTEASNQWNYFQSKSTKQSLAEMSRDFATRDEDKIKYQAKIDRYEKEKGEIKAVADKLEADATAWDKQSDEQMHQHHRWAQSTTVLQVSIALAAIALLTKKKWLEVAMFAAGGVGVVVGILAALHI
jgi:Na+/glutamate symporter